MTGVLRRGTVDTETDRYRGKTMVRGGELATYKPLTESWNSSFQNCVTITLLFKLPSVWCLLTAALAN